MYLAPFPWVHATKVSYYLFLANSGKQKQILVQALGTNPLIDKLGSHGTFSKKKCLALP